MSAVRNSWPISPNAEDYGRTIYELYMRRELIALCQELLHDAYKPRLEQEHGAMAIIEQTEGRLFRLAKTGDTGHGVQTLYEALRKAAESAQLAFNHDDGIRSQSAPRNCFSTRS